MEESKQETKIFVLRTTANREDQVMDFVVSNASKRKLEIYSIIRPHGLRSYIFLEAATKLDAEQAALNITYARGILPKEVKYEEIEHMLEQVKREMNIQKNDIVEIISGPFKREQAKVSRIDKTKEEVVVELLEAAVPIPITVKMDAVKVIRRESEAPESKYEAGEESEEEPSEDNVS
ncbi:MAG: transcription elongation factor Spt5 [Candidatus Woesearchaeota archaeon]|nr:transcription elongation factor Spt5 [Candidatus Woesearchaeota archaeon]